MGLLCFVFDLSSLPPASINHIKRSLLHLVNLHASRCWQPKLPMFSSDVTPTSINIAICCIDKNSANSASYEIRVIYKPSGSLNLREFHHAVNNLHSMNNISSTGIKTSFANCGQVSSLGSILLSKDGLLSWGSQHSCKKVVMISSLFTENTDSFRKVLMEAADHCIAIDFIQVSLINCADGSPSASGPSEKCSLPDLAINIGEFENCSFQQIPWDIWQFASLEKQWFQDMCNDVEGPIEINLLFQQKLYKNIDKVFCSLRPLHIQLADTIQSCRVRDKDRILYAKFLKDSVSNYVKKKTKVRWEMDMEGLLFGDPYHMVPSSEVDLDDDVEHLEINDAVFSTLCETLHTKDYGLLCSSTFDIYSLKSISFPCYYILLPAENQSFLVKRIAASEEFLRISCPKLRNNVVQNELRDPIISWLSKIGVENYNPLNHERGLHAKLNWLVKESLQLRPTSTQGTSTSTQKALFEDHEVNSAMESRGCNYAMKRSTTPREGISLFHTVQLPEPTHSNDAIVSSEPSGSNSPIAAIRKSMKNANSNFTTQMPGKSQHMLACQAVAGYNTGFGPVYKRPASHRKQSLMSTSSTLLKSSDTELPLLKLKNPILEPSSLKANFRRIRKGKLC